MNLRNERSRINFISLLEIHSRCFPFMSTILASTKTKIGRHRMTSPDITVQLLEEAKGFDWAELFKIGAPLLGGIIAFAVGLQQYWKAQRWKRVEFVANEMKMFVEDEAAKAAMVMLDWRRKQLSLYRYRGDSDKDQRVWVDYDLVADSLGTDPDEHYEKERAAIREIFDRYLGYLERFNSFIESKVVKANDLVPYMQYWTKLLSGADEKAPEVSKKVLPQFWVFVDHYGYEGARRFVTRYYQLTQELEREILKVRSI